MKSQPRSRTGWRLLATCVIGLVGGLLFVEIMFRWLLFGGAAAQKLGGPLRQAALYADSSSDDDFWKLFLELDRLQPPIPDESYHSELGWVSSDIDAATLRHRAAEELQGRRPVLLYGDSYVRCMGKREDCFEELLSRSDLNDRYFILNHGVQGYGLDQTHLLIDRTVDGYLAEKPVVVIGLQIDDALDRPILAIRGWPKPRLAIQDDRLVPEFSPVPRMDAYLRENPVTFRSYAWRYLQFGTNLFPLGWRSRLRGEEEIAERKRTISRKILAAIHEGLERRGVEHFFLLFYGEPYLDGSKAPDWREELLLSYFRDNAVFFTSTRSAILEDAASSGRPIAGYFSHADEVSRGHLLPEGNRAAFRALRDGLEHRFESP